jgi:hypothetical protein
MTACKLIQFNILKTRASLSASRSRVWGPGGKTIWEGRDS